MRGNAIAVLLIFSILLFSSAGAASLDFNGYKENNTSSTTESGPAPPLKEIHTNYEIGGDWLAPIVHGNVVYLVDSFRAGFEVMAINMSDGKVLWITKDIGIREGAWSAFYLSGVIYVDAGWYDGSAIVAINATNGNVVWHIKGAFSLNMVPTMKGIYLIENKTNKTLIVSLDPLTGKEKSEVEVKEIKFSLYYTYISVSGNMIYVFHDFKDQNMDGCSGNYSVYSFDITTGTLIWKYDIKNHASYLENSPMIVGKDVLYIPIWLHGKKYLEGGIDAINKTSGKLEWERITDLGFDDFQYKFAYSPEYHMIVRVNISGYLIAIDSRDGHILWISHVNDSKYAERLCDNVVIAHNYIYEYVDAWEYPNDMYNETEVGLLRLYKITNGKMMYQKELYAGGGEISSLELPGMAVTHGKVIIPEGYLQILEHDNGTESGQPNIVPWLIGLSTVIVGGAIAAVIVWKKKSHN